jgi:hypothetical protein
LRDDDQSGAAETSPERGGELTRLEQLAQALMISSEAVFID